LLNCYNRFLLTLILYLWPLYDLASENVTLHLSPPGREQNEQDTVHAVHELMPQLLGQSLPEVDNVMMEFGLLSVSEAIQASADTAVNFTIPMSAPPI
jgi:hypothetical protein